MKNQNVREKTRVKGTLLMCDGVADSQGDIVNPLGVTFPKKYETLDGQAHLPVKRAPSDGFVLGVANVKREDDRVTFEFDLPTSPLPPFPLYASIEGVVNESMKVGNKRIINQCEIRSILLSTTKNADERIQPIEEA